MTTTSEPTDRLVRAAPELLERANDLIDILNDFRGDFTDPAFIEALELLEAETREAIAKAVQS